MIQNDLEEQNSCVLNTVDLELSRHLAVPALPIYIQWEMEDDHTYHNMLKGM